MKILGILLGTIGIIAVILILGFGGRWWDLQMMSYFNPKYEQVRRNTFEQSRSFNEGMAQELNTLYLNYTHTHDQGEKDAIKSIVRERVAGYDLDNLNSPNLRNFVRSVLND